MIAALLIAASVAASDSIPAPTTPPASSRPDSTAAAPRVVRRFPTVEVTAPALTLASSQTVHHLDAPALRALPVDDLAQALALQAGVVAQGEELHVRGGRSGETFTVLDGVGLNEPQRDRPLAIPLLAVQSVDLVSGAPEARLASGLAGVIDLHTVDPGARPMATLRWQTDGRTDTHFDRVSALAGAPIHVAGLGFVTAADGLFDDTSMPQLRTASRHDVLGIPFGWRAENRMLGFVKLAPIAQPQRFDAQVLVSRQVHEPWDPQWTLDGWSFVPADPKNAPSFSTVPLPGYQRYRAADHLPITDDRALAARVGVSAARAGGRATLALGWLRERSVTSLDGRYGPGRVLVRPAYGDPDTTDRFHVLWGDYPLQRETIGDVLTLRGDAELWSPRGFTVQTGAGATYEEVALREEELFPLNWSLEGDPLTTLDTLRSYHAWAPGGFAYVQGRWLTGGLIVNGGLRAEYWTPGPQADRQSLPGLDRGIVSWSPRLGLAYPVSTRDAFSLGYMRIAQPPARDYLYDSRTAIGDRQPLGNPMLEPATLISYQAAVKHLIDATWSLQSAIFMRDLFGLVGARDVTPPHGATNPTYLNADEGHALGFELTLLGAAGEGRRVELRYTWLQAWGNESLPDGDAYGLLRAARLPILQETPLSWDRRHSIELDGAWRGPGGWTVAWSTSIGSPLPWTPQPVRALQTDGNAIDSRRLGWTETTNLDLEWRPPYALGLTLGLEARNLFDTRDERAATLDGYPNPLVNTAFDDYGAYRTETGQGGGAYLATPGSGDTFWVPVHDPRLFDAPRTVRMSVSRSW